MKDVTRLVGLLPSLPCPVELGGHGAMVSQAVELADDLVGLVYHASPHELGRRLSALLPGQWWSGNRTLTWNRGGRLVYLVDWSQMEAVKHARIVTLALGIVPQSWSLGGLARKIVASIGEPARHHPCTQRLLSGVPWAYRRVVPGVYEDMALIDLNAAYHQALGRLPSLHVHWIEGKPLWQPMARSAWARWREIHAALAHCKPLRLVLLGVMLGGGTSAGCYVKGERLPMRAVKGPYRSAALTVVRGCYELTYLQGREVRTAYANTDSLLLKRRERPRVWEAFGYPWRTVAEGRADVRNIDVYKIGERVTYWYAVGSRFALAEWGGPAPLPVTLAHWH